MVSCFSGATRTRHNALKRHNKANQSSDWLEYLKKRQELTGNDNSDKSINDIFIQYCKLITARNIYNSTKEIIGPANTRERILRSNTYSESDLEVEDKYSDSFIARLNLSIEENFGEIDDRIKDLFLKFFKFNIDPTGLLSNEIFSEVLYDSALEAFLERKRLNKKASNSESEFDIERLVFESIFKYSYGDRTPWMKISNETGHSYNKLRSLSQKIPDFLFKHSDEIVEKFISKIKNLFSQKKENSIEENSNQN